VKGMAIPVSRMVQEGPLWGNLSNATGASVGESLAMQQGPLWGNLSKASHTT
jgi:hypothetical protein